MFRKTFGAVLVLFAALLVSAAARSGPVASNIDHTRELTIDERVAAQRAIEEVYWQHRIWPKENPQPKPPLGSVMPESAIRAKVEDYLKKSNALEKWWQRPITAAQLGAELDRIAVSSRDPQTLREIFEALGNDPGLIAETLVRQTLADRLVRNWYSNDTRFHAVERRRAEAALATCARVDCMKTMGGEYRETNWRLRGEETDRGTDAERDSAFPLNAEEWKDLLDRVAAQVGGTAGSLPARRLSRLQETTDAFVISAVLSQEATEITTADTVWPKRAFETWWTAERDTLGIHVVESADGITLPALALSGCTNDTWASVGGEVPVARYLHSAVWTGAEMFVWGGGTGSVYMDTGGRYNPATDLWSPISATNAPSQRVLCTSVWTGTQVIVWGGDGPAANDDLNTGGRYNPSTDAWLPTSTGANVPSGRSWHTAVWTGGAMIVWGGVGGSYLNSGGRYDPSNDSWQPTSTGTNVPAGREMHTAVWTGNSMIVWGGFQSGSFLNTGGRYDPSANSWLPTSIGASVPDGRYRHAAVWTGSVMVVWGGAGSGGDVSTGGRYDPSADSWSPTSTELTVPSARFGPTAVWTGSLMIVWGGDGPDSNDNLNSGGRYNPITDTWTATSQGTDVPTARINHTAIWTGTEMIVWGGHGNNGNLDYLNTGGRYDPISDTWTPTALSGATSSSASAVWTGTEMIVWGGLSQSTTYRNTGGRYNPSTNSWTPTSVADSPTGRSRHTAIWTGTKMCVWGGFTRDQIAPFDHYWNTGGCYDPSVDGWQQTSMGANVPSGRVSHTAVWTGTEMIVWGGRNLNPSTNTGGRYDLTTDTWTATNTTDAPTTRSDHSAVWAQEYDQMIVWGGGGSNTGGHYLPSTNSWTPTSTGANVPSARSEHTAVWTGTKMCIWGGTVANGSQTMTGACLDPIGGNWTTTSTIGAPAGRIRHTAVWTGREMIVWGGTYFDSFNQITFYLNSGGRYDPSANAWTATSLTNAPDQRASHSAVWTGTGMIVWGGSNLTPGDLLTAGSRYCACPNGRIVFRDADGDGFGDAGISLASCDGSVPSGYVQNGLDCDDAGPTAWAVPVEVEHLLLSKPAAGIVRMNWDSQSGSAGTGSVYGIVTGVLADLLSTGSFATATCLIDGNVTPEFDDSRAGPDPELAWYYLVRASNSCGDATYGSSSTSPDPRDTLDLTDPCP